MHVAIEIKHQDLKGFDTPKHPPIIKIKTRT
jgi:hypothetical protein